MDIIKELWRGNVAQLEQCAMGDRQSKEVLKRAVKRNAVLLERRLYVCYNAYKKGGGFMKISTEIGSAAKLVGEERAAAAKRLAEMYENAEC